MRDQIEKRLKELKSEFESARKVLADLEERQTETRNTLLRLGGAIDVLEQELKKNGGNERVKKPILKPVARPVVTLTADLPGAAEDKDPGWYDNLPSPGNVPVPAGPDRDSIILRAIRRNAPPDRKFTPEQIDELFTGVYSRDEIDSSLDTLEKDGMISRIKTGIKVT